MGECPGHNVDDTTIFKNIVRYKSSQAPGSEHTWAHILEMWAPERRDFEWIINDEYLTDFYSTLSKDPACVEDCKDSGNVIRTNFPDNTDPGIVCETVLSQVQQGMSISRTFQEFLIGYRIDMILFMNLVKKHVGIAN